MFLNKENIPSSSESYDSVSEKQTPTVPLRG